MPQVKTLNQAAERLVEIGRDFHRRGWALGTSGNFSIVLEHDPLTLAITESSVDKSRLRAEQILCVDGNGKPLEGVTGKPSAETLLHVAIARKLNAGAVLHTHSVWSTVLSDFHAGRAGLFIEQYEMLKGLRDVQTHEHREWLPILENSQDMEALSRQATLLLAEAPVPHGVLIRRHGLYTWGSDIDEAVRHVEILEFLLESVGRRQMMEPPAL
jgi:methylthioribulose-1-phosphate dehydratase